MLLTKTKIPDGVYYKNGIEYDIVCLRATPTADGEAQERGGRNGYKGDNQGMGHQVHAIPQTKRGELQNHLRNTADTPDFSLPSPDHP